jgi:lysophospholipase L1-like esterase
MGGLLVRGAAAILLLGGAVLAWRLTVSPGQPEIAGLYSFRRVAFNLAVTAIALWGVYCLLGRKPMRHKILVCASQAIAIAVVVFLVEAPALFLGFDYRALFGTAADTTELEMSSRNNRTDPVLIHLHWPNSTFKGDVTGNLVHLGVPRPQRYRADVRYDRNGFRNDRDFDRADVVVVGDSFVEAVLVARDETLVARLETILKVPAANLGQIAYGLRQELEVLKRFGLPLQPKLVVWVLFGGNDLRDVEFYERQLVQFGKPRPPPALEQRLASRNALAMAGKLAVDGIRDLRGQPTANALQHSGKFKRADGTGERVYFSPPEDRPNPHQWEVAVDTLTEANRLTRAAGADFMVVYVPRKFRIYRPYLEFAKEHAIARWEINDLPEELGRWAAREGVAFVDTTPRLAEVVARGEHPYFIDDVHWNATGHLIAARAVAAELAAARLFPFRTAPAGSR